MSRSENITQALNAELLHRAKETLAHAQAALSSGDHDPDEMLRIATSAIESVLSDIETVLS